MEAVAIILEGSEERKERTAREFSLEGCGC
jgi:hypothetical protein